MDLISALRLKLDPAAPDVVAFVGAGGKSTALFRLAQEIAAQGRRVITTTTTRIAADQIRLSPAFVPVTDGRLPLSDISAALDKHGQCLLIGRESIERAEGVKKAGIEPHQVDELVRHAVELGVSAVLIEADGSRMLPAKAPASHEPALPASTTVLVPIMGMDALGLPIDETHVQRAALVRQLLGLTENGPARLTPAHMVRLIAHPNGGAKNRPVNARFIPLLNKVDDPPRLAGARLIADSLTKKKNSRVCSKLAGGSDNHKPGFLEKPGLSLPTHCEHTQISTVIGALGVADQPPIRERWGPVTVIILAAGASKRMGQPKQLLAVDGEAMVLRAVKVALQSGAEQVVVVTGAHAADVSAMLAPILASSGERLCVAHNAAWADGQATSMHVGLAACSSATEAALFMPADQPYLDAALLRALITRWRQGAQIAAPEVVGRLRGAPGLFDRSLWPELMAVRGDVGGRPVLRRHLHAVVTVQASATQLRDVDTLADLAGDSPIA